MESITGYVEHIVFRNEDNGYTVFHLNNDDGDLTCVGNFNYLSEGELVEVNGECARAWDREKILLPKGSI